MEREITTSSIMSISVEFSDLNLSCQMRIRELPYINQRDTIYSENAHPDDFHPDIAILEHYPPGHYPPVPINLW